jgi:hypothetical protein
MGGRGLAGEARAGAATAHSKNEIKNRSSVINFVNNTIKVLGACLDCFQFYGPAGGCGWIYNGGGR